MENLHTKKQASFNCDPLQKWNSQNVPYRCLFAPLVVDAKWNCVSGTGLQLDQHNWTGQWNQTSNTTRQTTRVVQPDWCQRTGTTKSGCIGLIALPWSGCTGLALLIWWYWPDSAGPVLLVWFPWSGSTGLIPLVQLCWSRSADPVVPVWLCRQRHKELCVQGCSKVSHVRLDLGNIKCCQSNRHQKGSSFWTENAMYEHCWFGIRGPCCLRAVQSTCKAKCPCSNSARFFPIGVGGGGPNLLRKP